MVQPILGCQPASLSAISVVGDAKEVPLPLPCDIGLSLKWGAASDCHINTCGVPAVPISLSMWPYPEASSLGCSGSFTVRATNQRASSTKRNYFGRSMPGTVAHSHPQ